MPEQFLQNKHNLPNQVSYFLGDAKMEKLSEGDGDFRDEQDLKISQ